MNDGHDFGLSPAWEQPHGGGAGHGFRRDLYGYIIGLVLAVILTAGPFAMVHWHLLPEFSLWIAIGLLALVQAVVHFVCFLHVRPPYENVDELLLVLFTALILVMMAGGTVWVLGNLHARMMVM